MAIPTASTSAPTTTIPGYPSGGYGRPLAIVTTLFFMWGGITSLNDILVPHLKAIFDLSYTKASLVQFAFFSGYFIFSLPSGKLIEWIGYKRSMVAGLFVMAIGCISFIPAAMLPSYPLFLAALLILAAGMTILQTSANPYVSVLGPPQTASSRLNLTQAFNSLGTTVFPKIGGALILSSAALGAVELTRVQQAATVKAPYLWLTVALVILAVAIAFSKLPTVAALEEKPLDDPDAKSVWQHRQLVLGAIGIFTYVGAEVAIGSFLISYFTSDVIGMTSAKAAAGFVSFYWGGAMIGRFIGSAILQKVRTAKLLALFAIIAGLLTIVSMLTFGGVALWSIILVGLFNSIMFPSIFTLGVEGLGNLTSKGSAVLIAAIVGGAIIPIIVGKLADSFGLHHCFVVATLCYIYIAYFAWDRLKHPVLHEAAAA